MTRPGDELFRTRPADAIVAPSGWFRLPSGIEVTKEPLIDATTGTPGLYARLSQPDAEDACKAVGGRLPTHAEILAAIAASHLVPPVLLPADHLMASRKRCEEHDALARSYLTAGIPRPRKGVQATWLETPPWDRSKPAGNIGKHRTHIPGMNPRMDEAITGWRKRDGSLWQKGGGPIPLHHGPGAAFRTDYGTTTIAVRDAGLSMPPAPASDKPPGDPRMRSTIRQGSTGADVGVWQRTIGVTADEQFGPATAAKTRTWQAAHGLFADGVVGPQSWRAAGEEPAIQTPHGPAPACVQALRDASRAWPERRRASDGIMGDASHQARPSDHNLGNAVDITHDPASGCDGHTVSTLAMRDPRVAYVIWDRRIWNPSISPTWRPYSGSNPHTHHVHISVRADARNDAGPWPWAPA